MMRQGRGSRIDPGAGAAGCRERRFDDGLEALWCAERLLARRYAKAVDCAQDFGLRRQWRNAHAEAERRAAKVARRLGVDGIPSCSGSEPDCFIEAMDLALGNGDPAAAETVARECLLLAEAQYATAHGRLWRGQGPDLTSAAGACA